MRAQVLRRLRKKRTNNVCFTLKVSMCTSAACVHLSISLINESLRNVKWHYTRLKRQAIRGGVRLFQNYIKGALSQGFCCFLFKVQEIFDCVSLLTPNAFTE